METQLSTAITAEHNTIAATLKEKIASILSNEILSVTKYDIDTRWSTNNESIVFENQGKGIKLTVSVETLK